MNYYKKTKKVKSTEFNKSTETTETIERLEDEPSGSATALRRVPLWFVQTLLAAVLFVFVTHAVRQQFHLVDPVATPQVVAPTEDTLNPALPTPPIASHTHVRIVVL